MNDSSLCVKTTWEYNHKTGQDKIFEVGDAIEAGSLFIETKFPISIISYIDTGLVRWTLRQGGDDTGDKDFVTVDFN